MKKVLVLGVGNELLRDEGVGVIVARALAHEKLPEEVEVVEGGTGGFDLVFELQGREFAVLVDAADMGAEPGAVRTLSLDDIEADLARPLTSLHQVGLLDVLEIGGLTGPMPEVWIVGVQPREIAPGFGLSPEVGAAVPRAMAEVRRLLEAHDRDSRLPRT